MLLRALFALVCTLFVHPQDGPDASLLLLIEDERVVVEVTCNLAFVDEVVDIAREDDELVDPVEMPGLRAALIEHFADTCRIKIDGVAVVGQPGEIHLTLPKEDLLPLFPAFGARALTQLTLQFEYSAKSPAQRVEIRWTSFPPDRIQDEGRGDNPINVAGLLIAYGQDTNLEFTTTEPEFVWVRPRDGVGPRFETVPVFLASENAEFEGLDFRINLLAIALIALGIGFEIRRRAAKERGTILAPALVLIGLASWNSDFGCSFSAANGTTTETTLPALLTHERALDIFRPLHANIYRAFDYTDESEIYDALAQSVEGDLLDEIYSQVYEGLVMREEGGAVSRVQAVTPIDFKIAGISLADDKHLQFQVDARWQVEGAVHHWGHAHTRLNEYRAEYTVVGRISDDGRKVEPWRIRKSRTLEQFRVASEPIPETL